MQKIKMTDGFVFGKQAKLAACDLKVSDVPFYFVFLNRYRSITKQ
jgi:hypothetical protein